MGNFQDIYEIDATIETISYDNHTNELYIQCDNMPHDILNLKLRKTHFHYTKFYNMLKSGSTYKIKYRKEIGYRNYQMEIPPVYGYVINIAECTPNTVLGTVMGILNIGNEIPTLSEYKEIILVQNLNYRLLIDKDMVNNISVGKKYTIHCSKITKPGFYIVNNVE